MDLLLFELKGADAASQFQFVSFSPMAIHILYPFFGTLMIYLDSKNIAFVAICTVRPQSGARIGLNSLDLSHQQQKRLKRTASHRSSNLE